LEGSKSKSSKRLKRNDENEDPSAIKQKSTEGCPNSQISPFTKAKRIDEAKRGVAAGAYDKTSPSNAKSLTTPSKNASE